MEKSANASEKKRTYYLWKLVIIDNQSSVLIFKLTCTERLGEEEFSNAILFL